MEKKWIWLLLFGLVAAASAYLWFAGTAAAPPSDSLTAPSGAGADSPTEPGAPMFGNGGSVAPPTSARPPAPPSGSRPTPPAAHTPPAPSLETFNSQPSHPPSSQQPYDAPPSDGGPVFEQVPPQAFENPEFVAPPPPPPQFDTDGIPFDEEPPGGPPQNFDNGAVAPPVPQDDFGSQPNDTEEY